MVTALDTANVFLKLSEPEVGDVITNLKIQKLVYYAQGFHLALYGNVLFNDEIVAWEHGPVVEALYQQYKQYGPSSIPIPEDVNTDMFTKDQLELLEEINTVYGQFSAWKLRDMTHSERPWIETQKNNIISPGLLKEFFLTKVQA